MAMIVAFPKLFVGDLKGFLVRAAIQAAALPTGVDAVESAFYLYSLRGLTIANHFAARRNVSRENLVEAGNHTPRPCLARFAVVMNPVATSFPHEVTRESTGIDHWIAPPNRLLDQPINPILHL